MTPLVGAMGYTVESSCAEHPGCTWPCDFCGAVPGIPHPHLAVYFVARDSTEAIPIRQLGVCSERCAGMIITRDHLRPLAELTGAPS